MKKKDLLSEILNAVVRHERDKARKEDDILNQKKQLWYGLMNQIDDETGNEEKPGKA